jgi:type VI secretion system secreted protein VgrG
MNAPLPLRRLDLSLGSGDALDVRHFHVSERMNELFEVTIVAVSPDPSIDLDAAAGAPATFSAHGRPGCSRTWTGIVARMRLTSAEEQGLSTYEVTIVPAAWLLSQRTDYRIFQHRSELDVAADVLGRWGITPVLQLSSAYKKRKYRVQYGESDLDFVRRMLEDAGVSFHFDEGGAPVLTDAPQDGPVRGPIPFRDQPSTWAEDHVTQLVLDRQIRPGRVTLRDLDHRKPPAYKLFASADGTGGIESRLERYHYEPGAFVFESEKGESTPSADDKGKYRVDEAEAAKLAARRLGAHRAGAKTVSFRTNAIDVGPGTVVSFSDHPHADIGGGRPYLVTGVEISGRHDGEWTQVCSGASADVPFAPERKTPRPSVRGVESATVVGPPGEEIHTDELGRVRLHFHWDRESKMDDSSSCWVPVSQGWGGSGYGMMQLPRVGQEVVVDFLGGDPDRPVVVGRLFTSVQRLPCKLPESKTWTVFRSQSTSGKAGYNEIRYDDQAGSELFRIQAERDYHELVKNDAQVVIGRDREEEIRRDEKTVVRRDREERIARDASEDVGHDRRRAVQNDEAVTVGNDYDRTVVNHEKRFVGQGRFTQIADDDRHQVGGNLMRVVEKAVFTVAKQSETATVLGPRTRTVAGPETVTVAANSTRSVSGADTLSVGGDRRETVDGDRHTSIAGDDSTAIDGSRTTKVKRNDSVEIALFASRNVGAGEQSAVLGSSSVSVGQSRTTQIGKTDTLTVGKGFEVSVSAAEKGGAPTSLTMEVDKIELKTKGASITLEGDTITLDAVKIVVDGDEHVAIHGKGLLKLDSTKGDVDIHGGPLVKINT